MKLLSLKTYSVNACVLLMAGLLSCASAWASAEAGHDAHGAPAAQAHGEADAGHGGDSDGHGHEESAAEGGQLQQTCELIKQAHVTQSQADMNKTQALMQSQMKAAPELETDVNALKLSWIRISDALHDSEKYYALFGFKLQKIEKKYADRVRKAKLVYADDPNISPLPPSIDRDIWVCTQRFKEAVNMSHDQMMQLHRLLATGGKDLKSGTVMEVIGTFKGFGVRAQAQQAELLEYLNVLK